MQKGESYCILIMHGSERIRALNRKTEEAMTDMPEFMSLKDYVYDYIAEEINNGNLQPGEKVNENQIIDYLKVSRTPVREALIQLSTEGFLENIPRRGFVIRKIDEKEAAEIYEIIGLLDGFVAKQVCDDLTEQDYKDMEFYIESADLAVKSKNYDAYYKQQEEFHDTYIKRSDNQTLQNLLRQTKKKFLKKEYILPDETALDMELYDTNGEHKKMLELFKAGDSEGLESYVRDVHWRKEKSQLETSL